MFYLYKITYIKLQSPSWSQLWVKQRKEEQYNNNFFWPKCGVRHIQMSYSIHNVNHKESPKTIMTTALAYSSSPWPSDRLTHLEDHRHSDNSIMIFGSFVTGFTFDETQLSQAVTNCLFYLCNGLSSLTGDPL